MVYIKQWDIHPKFPMIFQPVENLHFQLLRTLVKNPEELLFAYFLTKVNDNYTMYINWKINYSFQAFFKLSLKLTTFKPDSFH